jgi:hypothetical protein
MCQTVAVAVAVKLRAGEADGLQMARNTGLRNFVAQPIDKLHRFP